VQNKKQFLEVEWALHMVQDYWVNLGKCVAIWTVAQKREIRTLQKIQDNKVRTFTAAPFELLIASNRLMLDMNNRFYAAHGRTWSMVGMSKFFYGWQRLYDRLSRHPNAFELDATDWDSTCSSKALWGVCKFRCDMIESKEDQLRINYIYDQIVNSVMVLEDGSLVQKYSGNPSGSPNTVVDNTLILYRMFVYAWVLLSRASAPHLCNMHAFHLHVEAALYGDDNTFTCSDEVVGWFNPTNILPLWADVGIKATVVSSRPLKVAEVEFLSQGFEWYQEYRAYLPAPHLDKIIASVRYGTKTNDIRWHYLRACALRLDSWGSRACRDFLSKYILFISRYYSDCMVGEIKGIPIKEIMNAYKTDKELEILYTGTESQCSLGVLMDEYIKSGTCNSIPL